MSAVKGLQTKDERYKTMITHSPSKDCNMFSLSQFQQLLKPISQGTFNKMVEQHQSDKHNKGFSSWQHLIAMVYAQVSSSTSLRTLVASFNQAPTHHYHLGSGILHRSTLADANRVRTPSVFADAARYLMTQVNRQCRREGQQLLYLLDSTSITLKGLGFDGWTAQNRTRHTQGIKCHLLYEAHQAIPHQCTITPANVNDVTAALDVPLTQDARYVFDKGYCDYRWWYQLHQKGAVFVTRFKRNAALRVEESRPIPTEASHWVFADEVVKFNNQHPRAGRKNPYTNALRRIVVARPDHATPLVLATNDMTSPALVIAENYKSRWQIELYFKWMKQHLKIKRFLGRSENAVRVQILTALISYLLLRLYQQSHGVTTSLWQLLSMVRGHLFQRVETEHEVRKRREQQAQKWAILQGALFL
jgi:putative transposase